MTNLHLPATAVADYRADGTRSGRVHRIKSNRPAAPKGRNRRQYRVACGFVVRAGFPVRLALPEHLCGSCWSATDLDKAGADR